MPLPIGLTLRRYVQSGKYSERKSIWNSDCSQASGGFLNELKFILVEQTDVSFDLMLDGTGATGGEKKRSLAEIALFRLVTRI